MEPARVEVGYIQYIPPPDHLVVAAPTQSALFARRPFPFAVSPASAVVASALSELSTAR